MDLLSKNEIHTGEDFLSCDIDILLDFKGFGEKTVSRITETIKKEIASLESNNKESIIEEVEE